MKKIFLLVFLLFVSSASALTTLEFNKLDSKGLDCSAPVMLSPGSALSVSLDVLDTNASASKWDLEILLVPVASINGNAISTIDNGEEIVAKEATLLSSSAQRTADGLRLSTTQSFTMPAKSGVYKIIGKAFYPGEKSPSDYAFPCDEETARSSLFTGSIVVSSFKNYDELLDRTGNSLADLLYGSTTAAKISALQAQIDSLAEPSDASDYGPLYRSIQLNRDKFVTACNAYDANADCSPDSFVTQARQLVSLPQLLEYAIAEKALLEVKASVCNRRWYDQSLSRLYGSYFDDVTVSREFQDLEFGLNCDDAEGYFMSASLREALFEELLSGTANDGVSIVQAYYSRNPANLVAYLSVFAKKEFRKARDKTVAMRDRVQTASAIVPCDNNFDDLKEYDKKSRAQACGFEIFSASGYAGTNVKLAELAELPAEEGGLGFNIRQQTAAGGAEGSNNRLLDPVFCSYVASVSDDQLASFVSTTVANVQPGDSFKDPGVQQSFTDDFKATREYCTYLLRAVRFLKLSDYADKLAAEGTPVKTPLDHLVSKTRGVFDEKLALNALDLMRAEAESAVSFNAAQDFATQAKSFAQTTGLPAPTGTAYQNTEGHYAALAKNFENKECYAAFSNLRFAGIAAGFIASTALFPESKLVKGAIIVGDAATLVQVVFLFRKYKTSGASSITSCDLIVTALGFATVPMRLRVLQGVEVLAKTPKLPAKAQAQLTAFSSFVKRIPSIPINRLVGSYKLTVSLLNTKLTGLLARIAPEFSGDARLFSKLGLNVPLRSEKAAAKLGEVATKRRAVRLREVACGPARLARTPGALLFDALPIPCPTEAGIFARLAARTLTKVDDLFASLLDDIAKIDSTNGVSARRGAIESELSVLNGARPSKEFVSEMLSRRLKSRLNAIYDDLLTDKNKAELEKWLVKTQESILEVLTKDGDLTTDEVVLLDKIMHKMTSALAHQDFGVSRQINSDHSIFHMATGDLGRIFAATDNTQVLSSRDKAMLYVSGLLHDLGYIDPNANIVGDPLSAAAHPGLSADFFKTSVAEDVRSLIAGRSRQAAEKILREDFTEVFGSEDTELLLDAIKSHSGRTYNLETLNRPETRFAELLGLSDDLDAAGKTPEVFRPLVSDLFELFIEFKKLPKSITELSPEELASLGANPNLRVKVMAKIRKQMANPEVQALMARYKASMRERINRLLAEGKGGLDPKRKEQYYAAIDGLLPNSYEFVANPLVITETSISLETSGTRITRAVARIKFSRRYVIELYRIIDSTEGLSFEARESMKQGVYAQVLKILQDLIRKGQPKGLAFDEQPAITAARLLDEALVTRVEVTLLRQQEGGLDIILESTDDLNAIIQEFSSL
ncbi:TPA: hypothetical protein HA244_04620 [Candidatus Micrarchaeota archaeon]|nr:hypothetical protein [Candidatus Micrarchaeota archaeon]